jgi:type I restriction enzyme R subunit
LFTRPESWEFKRDAKILAFIARVASNVYQDPQLLLIGVEAKVKQLVDAYIAAQGIDPVIPPASIMDVKFSDELKKYGSSRTRASAMQHAIRLQLALKTNEDPTLYKTFSEKLEIILQELKDRWDEQIRAMEALLRDMANAEVSYQVAGIDPKIHGPFFGLLWEERNRSSAAGTNEELKQVVAFTQEIVAEIQRQIRTVDFWQDSNGRRQLENWLYTTLRQSRIVPRDKAENVAVRLVDLSYHRRRWLVT